MIHRRINQLKSSQDTITYSQFYSLFVDTSKHLYVSQSTPGQASRWTHKPSAKLNFNPKPQEKPKDTKKFQKPQLNKEEEIYAFKKYLIAALTQDIKHENAKIKLISDPKFVLEEAFEVLTGNSVDQERWRSQVTAEGLFSVISGYGNQNLSLEDC